MGLLQHEFSEAEYLRRRTKTLDVAREVDADRVLAFGENRSGVHVTYLTGWGVTRAAWLALDDTGARMWVSFHNHVPAARRVAHDVTVGDIGEIDASVLLTGATRVATLGVVPPVIRTAAAGVGIELVSVDGRHAELRTIKSEEEITALRLGAQASDLGAQGLIDAIVPGANDWELLAAARSAYTRAGARDHICYICVTDMDAPDRDVPSQFPEGRIVGPRSVVTFELSASVAAEYPGQILRTVFVGEPTPEYIGLHDVAARARLAMRDSMRDGVAALETLHAAECIEKSGYTTTDDLFHGLGMGYLEPVGVSPSRVPRSEPTGLLRSGMSVVIQPNVTTRDHRAGVQTGEMVVVRPDGIEDLHDFPEGAVMVS
ncbi:MAG: M24 family metallopeptidase [Candidatus Nanopelagicales bacterium]